MIKKLIKVFSITKPIPQSPILGSIEIITPKVSGYMCVVVSMQHKSLSVMDSHVRNFKTGYNYIIHEKFFL